MSGDVRRPRRVATIESERRASRRDADCEALNTFSGLKPTATIVWSLRDREILSSAQSPSASVRSSRRLHPRNPLLIPIISLSSLRGILCGLAALREAVLRSKTRGQKQGDSSPIDALSQNNRRPKTSLNGFLYLLSCGVARGTTYTEKSGMKNRRKCSKIWKKWKQLTSIGLRTTAHCAGPEVRMTNLGIKGAHIGSEEVRSGQKRVDVSVAKKSFLLDDLRRRRDLRLQTSDFSGENCGAVGNALRGVPRCGYQGLPPHPPLRGTFSREGRRELAHLPQGRRSLGFTLLLRIHREIPVKSEKSPNFTAAVRPVLPGRPIGNLVVVRHNSRFASARPSSLEAT